MKNCILFTLVILFTNYITGQTVLNEDFEAGTSIPGNWTNNDIAGNGEIWTIESSGEAVLAGAGNTLVYTGGGAVGNYAAFDSDAYGNNGTAEDAALESPMFDCSGLTSVTLAYNHLFAGNFGGSGFVEVNDGNGWVTVANYSGDNYVGGAINIDVSTQLAGVSNAQVRFRWTGNWSVAWYVDNVSVFQCTVTAPNAVSAVAPANGGSGVMIDYGTTTNTLGPFEWTPAPTGDPADSFNISLGTNTAGDDIGILNGFDSGGSINFAWQPNTTYYWFIEAVNCAGITPSSVFSFTTDACTETSPPAGVSAPVPIDGAPSVNVNVDGNRVYFSWTPGDPSANFTLNLGTANPPTQAFDNFESGDPITGLALNTTYFWSVDSVNCFGTTTGTVWSFTTNAALSVVEEEIEVFSVSPNPVSDILNIKSVNDIDSVFVYDLLGKEVASFNNNNIINSSVNLSNIPQGLYLVQITSGEKTQTIKVAKK
ncbi:T9SS type A sorting domain-containing protein [Winogradskyella sp. A2]|uniref:T9SS type A sorting domain-containing protein n=1 Tax=Winogradskyella sp. A2 TaxID=3366944 RepID=UPI00398C625E